MRNSLLILFSVLCAAPTEASARSASLKGGVISQKRQNRVADRHHLTRLKDLDALKKSVRSGLLVEVSDTDAYRLGPYLGYLDPGNEAWYRHTRTWTKRFLDRELGDIHRATGERFKVTSLVRTRAYQRKLVKSGANAISGRAWWRQSSHLTGATVDISYKDMSADARKRLEKRLLALEKAGLIEATKEHASYCFHIMVFPEYGAPKHAPKTESRKTRKTKTRR